MRGSSPRMTVVLRGITKMLQAEDAEVPVKVEFDNFEHGFPEGFGPGGWGRLAYAIGIAFAAFQLVVAAWNVLPSQVVRGVHVGSLILMTFGLIGNFTAKNNTGRAAGWLIGSAGFLCGLYQWIFYADLIARAADRTRLDLVVAPLLRGWFLEASGVRRGQVLTSSTDGIRLASSCWKKT